ncbi:GNAT family N-acetyltransferase [Sporomusa termitida]|uniref:N-acetyltransferase domain-containing protein n=1 Tax=Sporomusa termitida TaxID=2377 RepID=A0A517DWE1_9FIRM|nr:GNAT family N-acetyltransferase [Sporomusa termitida]QDR81668.1 hypothetical protein SPTER_30780 [Sporomusa termitida]
MNTEIVFATDNDEEELQELFTECGMGLAGDIEEHLLIKRDHKIMAGAMLAQVDDHRFHLLVFAVRADARNQGTGRHLLQELLHRPGHYCRPEFGSHRARPYQVTTVAKGEAARFYEKNGFAACAFSALAAPYDRQCEACPEQAACRPVAMLFARS